MNKKTIIFSIELSDRELFAKTLLSLEMARRGFRVYIGNFRSIHEHCRGIRSSIFFHKSSYVRRMAQYKREMGAVVAVLDEEAGIAIPTCEMQDFCEARFGPMNSDTYDYIFTIGDGYTKRLQGMPNLSGIKIISTGWPRIDLWRDDYSYVHAEKVNELESKHGEYWLFVSSFGFTSKAGLDFQVARAPYDLNIKSLYNVFDALNNYIDLIKTLSAESPKKIIIRPHTSESVEEWESIFSDCPNVVVIRDGDVTPWLLAASGVITYRSTVTVQAALNGIPTVQYKINEVDGIDDLPAFKVSKCANSAHEVLDYLLSFKGDAEKQRLKEFAADVLKDNVSSLSGELAAVKIASILSQLDIVPQPPIEVHPLMSLMSYIWDRYKYAEHRVRKVLFKKRAGYRISRFDKIPNGIRAQEIQSIIDRLQLLKPSEAVPVLARQVATNLVVLERAENNPS